MAGYTKLEAVNRLLRTIHEAPVAALDTGTSSIAGLAETYLDEADKEIQSKGWAVNTEYDIYIPAATTKIVKLTLNSGTYVLSEDNKTITKTAAFTAYTWAHGDQLSLGSDIHPTIAAKISNDVIVLQDEYTASDVITPTTIGWHHAIVVPADILTIDDTEGKDVVVRNAMLFDRENDTFSLEDGVTVTQVRQLPFDTLPLTLQRYIIAKASIEFQRRMTQGQIEDSFLMQEYRDAKNAAMREESETADGNVLEDDHAQNILGNYTRRNTARR